MNPNSATICPVEAQYQELKHMDQTLESMQQAKDEAQQLYEKTLQQFAALCHQLWQLEKAPGNHQGKGFHGKLKGAGINAGRAYRAMKKFFPADFPGKKETRGIGRVRFTRRKNGSDTDEVLECIFALTAEEKAEFQRCLKLVGAEQVQHLLLESVKQAAAAMERNEPEKQNQENTQDKTNSNGNKNVAKAKTIPSPQPSAATKELPLGNGLRNGGNAEQPPRPQRTDPPMSADGSVWRMNRLWENLDLKGARPDLQTLGMQFNLQKMENKLDWVDAHPEWCDNLRGKTTSEFVYALMLLFI